MRTWLKGLVLAAAVIALMAGFLFPTFQKCIETPPQKEPSNANQEAPSISSIPSCVGAALNETNGTITAIATIFIAFFTGTLWFTTNKTVRLAREEFIASHRPRLRIRSLAFEEPRPPEWGWIHVTIANIGETKATITAIRADFGLKIGWNWKRRLNIDATGRSPPPDQIRFLPPGVRTAFVMPADSGLTASQRDDIEKGHLTLIAGGEIRYLDENGILRITGFSRLYDRTTSEFVKTKDDDANEYED